MKKVKCLNFKLIYAQFRAQEEEEVVNPATSKAQKKEKLETHQPSVDLLDKILEDQTKTFPITHTKKSQKEKRQKEDKVQNRSNKNSEREILTPHERRKRMHEEMKRHGKLEHRIKKLITDKTNATDSENSTQLQMEEKSEMETFPVGFTRLFYIA